VKGKEEKERYTQLNAEFQRIARRNEKTFLSEQCKEIEENNRTGKTSPLCVCVYFSVFHVFYFMDFILCYNHFNA